MRKALVRPAACPAHITQVRNNQPRHSQKFQAVLEGTQLGIGHVTCQFEVVEVTAKHGSGDARW